MSADLKWVIWLTEAEYKGPCFNGPSMRETVAALSLEQVASENTYEGYSAWELFLHSAYCKWLLITFINPDTSLDFPFEKTDFPKIPGSGSQSDWDETLKQSDIIHDAYIAELKQLDPDKMEGIIKQWKCSLGMAVAWASSHDSFHAAQIRSMGVPGLRQPKG